ALRFQGSCLSPLHAICPDDSFLFARPSCYSAVAGGEGRSVGRVTPRALTTRTHHWRRCAAGGPSPGPTNRTTPAAAPPRRRCNQSGGAQALWVSGGAL